MSSGELGSLLPEVVTGGPGPAAGELARRLAEVESRNVTRLGDEVPVFWEEARGANVRDADGNVYVDLTAAFGVALTGHRDPAVVEALRAQAGRMIHGMGDVHPPALKVELLERLCALLPWPDGRAVLSSSGSEAVETALKTALLATGRPGILSFEGGYHGLTLGALSATARPYFREPFRARLYGGSVVVPFPDPLRRKEDPGGRALERVERALVEGAPNGDAIGAVVVEPVQGRAGVRIPPDGFLADLSGLARDHGAVVVADEVFTGMGRTGSLLASTRLGLEPDLVCLGKALGGGLPLSACVGPSRIMDAWPPSPGEALHTSTFLGHPLACASGLAFLERLTGDGICARAREVGRRLRDDLETALSGTAGVADVRGLGLMIGVELCEDEEGLPPARGRAARVARRALERGVLVLPAGDEGHVVEVTPPATITPEQAAAAVDVVAEAVQRATAA